MTTWRNTDHEVRLSEGEGEHSGLYRWGCSCGERGYTPRAHGEALRSAAAHSPDAVLVSGPPLDKILDMTTIQTWNGTW